MNTDQTAESLLASLSAAIDRHAAGQPVGKLESHDLQSLSRRILAPIDVTKKLLAAGVLGSQGPVHKGDDTGHHSFPSDQLNEIRRAVLVAIVEKIVEESDGAPEQVTMAAGDALRQHAASFVKKTGEKSEFCRFPVGTVQFSRRAPNIAVLRRLLRDNFVQLARRVQDAGELETLHETHMVQLAQYRTPDDEPTLADRLGAAAKVAGAGAVAYGAAGYLRGRMNRPGIQFPGIRRNGAGGILADTLAGLRQNNADVKRIAGRIGGAVKPAASALAGSLSIGSAKVAAVLAGRRLAA